MNNYTPLPTTYQVKEGTIKKNSKFIYLMFFVLGAVLCGLGIITAIEQGWSPYYITIESCDAQVNESFVNGAFLMSDYILRTGEIDYLQNIDGKLYIQNTTITELCYLQQLNLEEVK